MSSPTTSSIAPVAKPPARRSVARRVLGGLGRAFTPLVRPDFWFEYLWLVLAAAFSTFSLLSLVAVLILSVALSPLLIGVLFLAGDIQYARLLGGAHRRLARALLGIEAAAPRRPVLRPGLWNWLRARIGDPAGWWAIAYLVLRLPLSLVGLLVTWLSTVYASASLAYPLLWFPIGPDARLPVFDIYSPTWPGTLLWALSGLVVLVLIPYLLHGFVALDRLMVVGLLGHHGLVDRVRDLEESRATAVEDAALRLRRIERDLHDGAQAQLVALAMKLGLAKDELAGEGTDVAQVRELVTAAHANAKQALTELRDLARGIHPAALDAGLDVALSTLVATSGVEAKIDVDLEHRPPPSIETIVYFSASELITNAAKHAKSAVVVRIREDGGVLWLNVADRGPGGARVEPGGGLAGIAERLRTVDGELLLSSPSGGPTTATARVPLPR